MPRILRSLEHRAGEPPNTRYRHRGWLQAWSVFCLMDGLQDSWLPGEQRRHVSTKDARARPCPTGAQNFDLAMGRPSWVRPQDREGESGSWY